MFDEADCPLINSETGGVSVLQLWDHGHRETGCLQRRTLFRVLRGTYDQPHRVGGWLGGGERGGVLGGPQLLGGALGEYGGLVCLCPSTTTVLQYVSCVVFFFFLGQKILVKVLKSAINLVGDKISTCQKITQKSHFIFDF